MEEERVACSPGCGSEAASRGHPPRAPALPPARETAHLVSPVHVVLVGRPGVHVRDRVQQQLCYLDALRPGEGGSDVEGGQGPQLQRGRRRVRALLLGERPPPREGGAGLSRGGPCCLRLGREPTHSTASWPAPAALGI